VLRSILTTLTGLLSREPVAPVVNNNITVPERAVTVENNVAPAASTVELRAGDTHVHVPPEQDSTTTYKRDAKTLEITEATKRHHPKGA
jgi:hypothetical protein